MNRGGKTLFLGAATINILLHIDADLPRKRSRAPY
jgi:hypothetical protein